MFWTGLAAVEGYIKSFPKLLDEPRRSQCERATQSVYRIDLPKATLFSS